MSLYLDWDGFWNIYIPDWVRTKHNILKIRRLVKIFFAMGYVTG